MAYSNKHVPNDPKMFPPPQRWMVWIADIEYAWDPVAANRDYKSKSEGKLRHYFDFESARRGMRWVGSKGAYRPEQWAGKYIADWTIYEWDETANEWAVRFEGYAGQNRDDNPISKVRLSKDQKIHPIDAIAEDATLASIMDSAARRAS